MEDISGREYLEEFEELNTTCDSIYDLGDFKVLIILEDGTNLTDWEYVEYKEEVIYISEDLSDCSDLSEKYKGFSYLKGIVAFGVADNVKSMRGMFCE